VGLQQILDYLRVSESDLANLRLVFTCLWQTNASHV